MIDVSSRIENEITVVDIEGKMNTGASPDAEKFLNVLLDEGVTKILLNLEELDFIASTGLRVILSTGKKLAKISGRIAICNPNHTVMDVLKMSGFSQMFNVFEDEAEAIASF